MGGGGDGGARFLQVSLTQTFQSGCWLQAAVPFPVAWASAFWLSLESLGHGRLPSCSCLPHSRTALFTAGAELSFQMHFLLGAREKPGPVGPGGANTCDPKSEEALSFLQGDPTSPYLLGKQNQRDREVEGRRQSVCPPLQTSLRNQWRHSSLQLRELSSLKYSQFLNHWRNFCKNIQCLD